MMMTPFTLLPGLVMEDSFSMIVIPELSIIEYGLIIVLTAVLYTLYNLWEDWYLEKNRFMMRMIRDSLCSGLFYMFAVRLIIAFFVKT